jgi:hypothetical protein
VADADGAAVVDPPAAVRTDPGCGVEGAMIPMTRPRSDPLASAATNEPITTRRAGSTDQSNPLPDILTSIPAGRRWSPPACRFRPLRRSPDGTASSHPASVAADAGRLLGVWDRSVPAAPARPAPLPVTAGSRWTAMSFLLERAPTSARPAGDLPPSPLGAPVQAALRAAAGGLVPIAVPVVFAWVFGAGGQATWAQAVRLSLGLWLLAQHAGLAVSGGHVGLVPIGLALVPLASTWFAGRRLARIMDPRAERIAAGATRAVPKMLSWWILVVFVGAYCLLAALASLAAGMPGMRPISAQAVLGAGVVAALGGGAGALAYRFGGVRGTVREVLRRAPDAVRPMLRPAIVAQGTQLAVGAAVVAALLVVHFPGVTALQRALDPGTSGSVVLTLGQLLLLPNLVLWACAVAAGPGFAIGTGTSVTVTTSQLGPLPAVPVLAALPAPESMPPGVLALLAVPVLAGVAAGVLVVRSARGAGMPARLRHAGGAALLSGLASGVLAWLSGGPAGPGRLAQVGPNALLTGVAAGLEVGAGAALAVAVAGGAPQLLAALKRPGDRSGGAVPADDARTPDGTASGPGA